MDPMSEHQEPEEAAYSPSFTFANLRHAAAAPVDNDVASRVTVDAPTITISVDDAPTTSVLVLELFYEWKSVLGPTFDIADIRSLMQAHIDAFVAKNPTSFIERFLNEYRSPCQVHPHLQIFIGTLFERFFSREDALSISEACRHYIRTQVELAPRYHVNRVITLAYRLIVQAVSHRSFDQDDAPGVPLSSLAQCMVAAGGLVIEPLERLFNKFEDVLYAHDFQKFVSLLCGESGDKVLLFLRHCTAFFRVMPHDNPLLLQDAPFRMRRITVLQSQVCHAFDGVQPGSLWGLARLASDSVKDLRWCVAALVDPPELAISDSRNNNLVSKWFEEKTATESDSCGLLGSLMQFHSSRITNENLFSVCALLLATRLDPSAMLSVSHAASSLVRWALFAAQCVAYERNIPFPPLTVSSKDAAAPGGSEFALSIFVHVMPPERLLSQTPEPPE